ncbi:rRNA processing/ribosome biogenesis family protein [Candida albicans]|uniref:Pre-rRNA-processing protein RIX1 n=1 Tax=Candida albicans TaxID=5476 RepID=A0A8H6C1T8_CANAX|nr:rRNA processing/ribosome biogenesis family protein [Candida albicans]
MSINIVLEEIKGTLSSIIPLLSILHNDKQILSSITKTELNHLISRTLNLVRSSDVYNKWCGINLIRVIVEEYSILASEGNNLMNSLLQVLEAYQQQQHHHHHQTTIDLKILTSCIETINYMGDLIRGKPTLTREILTPKLNSIIGYYFQYLHFAPLLILNSLQTLLKFHPTTFRPFGNKLKTKLINLIDGGGGEEFINYPQDLQLSIYNTLAMLPIIEKIEPETKWYNDVINILGEINGLIQIYQEFLNFKDDQDLSNLIQKLPNRPTTTTTTTKLLTDLSIDFNKPQTILSISNHLNILMGVLKSYLTVETSFTVKLPLGLILTTCELICSINTKFLSFKGDIRDETIKKLIKFSLIENYKTTLGVLIELIELYKGSLIPHLTTIWSFLETLIPFQNQNKRIVNEEIIESESLYVEILQFMKQSLSLLGNVSENTQLLRFVDMALILVEPRINPTTTTTTTNNNNNNNNTKQTNVQQGKKQKKRKNTSSVALSDILSHEHLFMTNIPTITITTVRSFINQIITKIILPPTQHYKIMRYLIIESIHAKYYNLYHNVPIELKKLLINAVLYPGVFNNPKFPPLPKYINLVNNIEEEEQKEEQEEDAIIEDEVEEPIKEELTTPLKKRKLDIESNEETDNNNIIPVEDQSKIFTATKVEKLTTTTTSSIENNPVVIEELTSSKEIVVESPVDEPTKVDNIIPTTTTTTTTTTSLTSNTANANDDNDNDDDDESSDFEMPEINLDQDSDDE